MSTRSIIALLQDIRKITAAGVAKPPQNQNNHPSARDYSNLSSGNCIPVLHTTRSNNPIIPVKKFNRQLNPLFNKFTSLMDIQEPSESSPNNVELNKEQSTRLKKSVTAIGNKIMILGDSHARNCSVNVQHNLKKIVVIQGLTKPGANIEQIVSPAPKIIADFTKKRTLL